MAAQQVLRTLALRRALALVAVSIAVLIAVLIALLPAVAATSPAAGSGETRPRGPGTAADGLPTTLTELERKGVELHRRVLSTLTAHRAAQARAAALRQTADEVSLTAARAAGKADRLHHEVSGRSAAPGLGVILAALFGGDDLLDEAVEAARVQTVESQAPVEAERLSTAADAAVAAAKRAWTDATTEAAHMDLRIRTLAEAEASSELAVFHPSYRALPAQDLRNRTALQVWRKYLVALGDALVVPPPASVLAGPELPAPLTAVRDATGARVPGVAQVWRVGADPLVVLPAETIRVVSTGFSRVGDPSADARGADAYACGGFVRDVARLGGHVLPATSIAQWQWMANVPSTQLQIGDLIYIGDPLPGLHRSGLYLGSQLWLAANPDSGAVGVETLAGRKIYGIRRATLPRLSVPMRPPAPAAGSTPTGCGTARAKPAVVPPPTADPPGTGTGTGTGTTTAPKPAWMMPIAGSFQVPANDVWLSGVYTGRSFAAPVGTAVRASRAGVVAVEHPAWAGTLVRIEHGSGLTSWYGHLTSLRVRPRQKVSAGAVLGAVGNVGVSARPHLFFGIRVDGRPIDPMPLLAPGSAVKGFGNGMIPAAALCRVGSAAETLRCDAAVAFRLLDQGYTSRFGKRACVTDAYRSLTEQQQLYRGKPELATAPGALEHGTGVAVDLCGGAQKFGTLEHAWLLANGPALGWRAPLWARPGGTRPEPRHFEFRRTP